MHDINNVSKLNKLNEFNIMVASSKTQKIRSISHDGNAADV